MTHVVVDLRQVLRCWQRPLGLLMKHIPLIAMGNELVKLEESTNAHRRHRHDLDPDNSRRVSMTRDLSNAV